jgi:hypothetical protein
MNGHIVGFRNKCIQNQRRRRDEELLRAPYFLEK